MMFISDLICPDQLVLKNDVFKFDVTENIINFEWH